MYGMHSRALLQSLAETRRRDAELLLASARYSGAYYLCGYAVECALKAIVASQFVQDVIPSKKLVSDTYTHDLLKLVGLAGLKPHLDKELGTD
jgi:hypothetical protein